jgi:hypothetical protein
MTSVRFSATASAAPRLIAVVVLPTPPFWFAMAMTWDIESQHEEWHGAANIPSGRAGGKAKSEKPKKKVDRSGPPE